MVSGELGVEGVLMLYYSAVAGRRRMGNLGAQGGEEEMVVG
jgi:hypothetical protein